MSVIADSEGVIALQDAGSRRNTRAPQTTHGALGGAVNGTTPDAMQTGCGTPAMAIARVRMARAQAWAPVRAALMRVAWTNGLWTADYPLAVASSPVNSRP